MEQVVLSRQELYDLVWSESLTTVSKKYKIPYPDFRKICEKMAIPLPGSGYWTKLKFNKEIEVVPLDTEYKGENILTISIAEYGSTNNIIPPKPVKQIQKQIEQEAPKIINVPSKLTQPDKLIIAARETLNKQANGHWRTGILSTHRDEIRIACTAGLIARSLRFMDTLIKTLRHRGHDISVRYDETYAVIEGTEIKIGLRERTVRIPPTEGRYSSDYKPTGILYLKMDNYTHHKEWDDKRHPLEEQISNIVAKLEMVGQEGKIRREENEKWWAAQREKKRIEEEIEARKEKELQDFKYLLKQAKRHNEATQLRAYIKVVEQNAVTNGTVTEELNVWLDWARKKADWYDPLIEQEDCLLENSYRTNLEYKKKNTW